MGISILPLLLLACEALPDDVLYNRSDVPDVLDIGEMRPIEIEEYWQTVYEEGAVVGGYGLAGTDPTPGKSAGYDTSFDTWYNMVPDLMGADSEGRVGIYYGELGPGEKGTYGGATLNFKGTGGKICVVVDPQSIFWNQQRSSDVSSEYTYQDRLDDDGDLDTYAGLSAYYTGNPGVSMGDFRVPFTDAAGEDQYVEFDECAKATNGVAAHAGRATAEYCDIDTSAYDGVNYTVALHTFSLPIDDSVLGFGVGVFEVGEGGCAGSATNSSAGETAHPPASGASTECVLPMEWAAGVADGSGSDAKDCADEGGEWTWECLERLYCQGKPTTLNNYCAAHIGEDDPPCIDNGHVVASGEDEE